MSQWRRPAKDPLDTQVLVAAICRFTIEQTRDVYLALRERPRASTLPRPSLGERIALFKAQHLPSSKVRGLSARMSALWERTR